MENQKIDLKTNLELAIDQQIDGLAEKKVGSEEAVKTAEVISKLYNVKIDADKVESDKASKKAEIGGHILEAVIQGGVTVGVLLISQRFNARWMKAGYSFEETGKLCSDIFKEFRMGLRKK